MKQGMKKERRKEGKGQNTTPTRDGQEAYDGPFYKKGISVMLLSSDKTT